MKHLTLSKFILGIIMLSLMATLKYFNVIGIIIHWLNWFESNEYIEYLLSGILCLVTNLGIRGLVEAFVSEYIEPLISNFSKLPENVVAHNGETQGESSSSGAKSSGQGSKGSGSVITMADYQWSSDDDNYIPSPDSPEKELSDEEYLRREEIAEANRHINSTVSDFKQIIDNNKDENHIKAITIKLEDAIARYQRDNVPAAQAEIPKLAEKLDICNDKITELKSGNNTSNELTNLDNSKDKGKGKAN